MMKKNLNIVTASFLLLLMTSMAKRSGLPNGSIDKVQSRAKYVPMLIHVQKCIIDHDCGET